jgi:hypothetical protein
MVDRKGSLLAVLLVSSALTSCGRREDQGWDTGQPTRYCVDRQGQRVPDAECANDQRAQGTGGISPFLWYYLGTLNSGQRYYVPPIGGPASGGGYMPLSGLGYRYAPASSGESARGFAPVTRGGFGAIGGGFGGGFGGAGE